MKAKIELLAPAGNIVNFQTAIEAGADAVYVGAPGINARNLSRDLRFEEILAMIEFARKREKKVYLAANSLIVEDDLSSLIETIALLDTMVPDALIVQDLALIRLVKEHFPKLPLHASTLMGAFNAEAVNFFGDLGCERVVLARELTLKEIEEVSKRSRVELEVFVHGAMCFSYSGLCLFSSYLGGKSGLRGRCVQPCRRGYTYESRQNKTSKGKKGKKGGNYLFSMNDLEGVDAVEFLKNIGVASLKIEGRLRSANYVQKIVEAYRLLIDADEESFSADRKKAQSLIDESMGRKTVPGYFFTPQPQESIVPFHSGNMGIHLGNFIQISSGEKGIRGKLKLKYGVKSGDRLRLHIGNTGDRKGFTLHELHRSGEKAVSGDAGDVVTMELPSDLSGLTRSKVDLYKVDSKDGYLDLADILSSAQAAKSKLTKARKNISKKVHYLKSIHASTVKVEVNLPRHRTDKKGKIGPAKRKVPEIWLRTDSDKLVLEKTFIPADMVIINMEKATISQSARIKKYYGKRVRNIIWALPPVMYSRDLGRIAKQVKLLIRSGFRNFQVGHSSQVQLFANENVNLIGDYTLNLSNSLSLHAVAMADFTATQLAIELDRKNLKNVLNGFKNLLSNYEGSDGRVNMKMGLTVYGTPPLFSSRLHSMHFQSNKKLVSPKGEKFIMKKKGGVTLTLPERPFSLLPYLNELYSIGLDYAVIDLTNMRIGQKEKKEIEDRLTGKGKIFKLPTFNYLGKLE